MLILLPPSETKRDGGTGPELNLAALSFPSLSAARRRVLSALVSVSRNRDASVHALKLGPKQLGEIDRNRAVKKSATMPAMDRYTGVLFDAWDPSTLTDRERAFAGESVAVHSALFGPVMASDLVPAYRLSHDSRLPDLPLKKHWASPVSAVLAARQDLVIDLRSEGYVALGPGPAPKQLYVRVVSADGGRALNHFNKQAKGQFVRALVHHGEHLDTVDSLIRWAHSAGFAVSLSSTGELELAV